MARMRALENGRQMVRGTNNGISAIVDVDGAIVAKTAQFETTVLAAEVQPHGGETPFARYGFRPVMLLSLVLVAVAAFLELGRRLRPR